MMLRIAELYYRSTMNNSLPDSLQMISNDVELKKTKSKESIEKGNSIVKRLADIYQNDLQYYLSLKGTPYAKGVERETNQALAVFQELIRLSKLKDQKAITVDLQKRFEQLEAQYSR